VAYREARLSEAFVQETLNPMRYCTLIILLLASCSANTTDAFEDFGYSYAAYRSGLDADVQTNVFIQMDPQQNPLFVLAWTSQNDAGRRPRLTVGADDFIVAIHGRSIRPSVEDRKIYALQVDYTLVPVTLNDEQVQALFRQMQNGFHASYDVIWQENVSPSLHRIEDPDR
jgi:hypothetical protein